MEWVNKKKLIRLSFTLFLVITITVSFLIFKTTDAEETSSVENSIQPLEAPIITDYPQLLQTGDPIIIKGISKYPYSEVTIWLEKDGELANGRTGTDKDGNFTFVYDKRLEEGNYNVSAEIVDSHGVKSNPSQKVVISIQPSQFLKVGSSLITFLLIIIPLVALILILAVIIWYGFHRLSLLTKKMKKRSMVSEMASFEIIHLLKVDLQEQVKLLEKVGSTRKLTKEEDSILKQLKKNLEDIKDL